MDLPVDSGPGGQRTGDPHRIAAATPNRRAARIIRRRHRMPSGRVALGALLMTVAAALAYAAAQPAPSKAIRVLIAAHDLHAGDVITADDVRIVDLEVPGEVRGLFGSVEAAVGRQLTTAVGAGEFIQLSATTTVTDGEQLEMTLGLSATRLPGNLRAGERVDVFATWSSDRTQLIAVDARVLETPEWTTGGVGAPATVVRIGVADLWQLEALVHAHAVADLTIVRAAIGTDTGEVGREYRPSASGAGS